MIQPFALNFFAPLYFVSVGLKADFTGQFDGALVCWVFLIACLGKIVGAGMGAMLGGLSARESLTVGIGLNARGAVEIILASVALEQHLIDQRIFVALVAMAFATTIISGPILKRLIR
jgi:Kef-type K+ transport system membrane component KefB